MQQPSATDLERAATLLDSGAVDAAAAVCESALQRDRRNPALRHLFGVIRLRQGRAEQAAEILRRLNRDLPANSPVMVDLGQALGAAGKTTEANDVLRRAAQVDPRSPLPWLALGSLSEAIGRRDQARTAYQEALSRDPNSIDALAALGDLALADADEDGAIAHFKRTVEIDPHRAELRVNLGNALKHAGRTSDAEHAYTAALDLDSNCVLALYNLGLLLFETDRALESLAYLERVVEIAPDFIPARYNLGLLLADVDDFDRALEHLGAVVALDPSNVDAAIAHAECLGLRGDRDVAESRLLDILRKDPHCVRALKAHAKIQAADGRWQEAADTLQLALERDGDDMELWLGAYKAQSRLGNAVEANAAFDRAYALDPPVARAWFARRALAAGDLTIARQQFEYIATHENAGRAWRVDVGNIDLLQGRFSASAWDALRELLHLVRTGKPSSPTQLPPGARLAANLRGKTVLVRGEQGIGDELFFMRWLPELMRRGASVVYQIHTPKLVPLLRRQRLAAITLIGPDDRAPTADVSVWVNELPAVLMAGDDALLPERDIPCAIALSADTERCKRWAEALAAFGPPPYVGVTWRAGAMFSGVDIVRLGLRSLSKRIEPSALGAALRAIDGTIVVVQRKPGAADLASLGATFGRPVHDLSAMNDDLEDALALLAVMDAYIGVSNTNMHLLAGLGRSAHVLMPWLPEWRWRDVGSESPWFPGFRIHRQTPSGSWNDALAQLVHEVAGNLGLVPHVAHFPEATTATAPAQDTEGPLIVPRALEVVVPEHASMATRRELISESYRRMQETLHENPDYGTASVEFAPTVADFIRTHSIRELLDYGAGKGRLGQELRKLIRTPLAIQHYEPSSARWSRAPDPSELVACIDVLEHIEPELLDNVLDDLKRVTRRYGLFTIATGPARKILPDGRNAHLIQQPPAWWLPKLMQRFELAHFNRFARGFLVVVEARMPLT